MTVWGYQTKDCRRVVFFYAGSIVYSGSWLGPSDSVWIVPGTFQEVR